MPAIQACALPKQALIAKYARDGAYTDCYAIEINRLVSHAEYIEAFYTSSLFKVERLLLEWLISKPSTDGQAKVLAAGSVNMFAAWRVEERSVDQLLMCDLSGRTRSWLMVSSAGNSTRLYFGSAVVPPDGKATLGFIFKALLGLHKLYSRALLWSVYSNLARR